MGTVSIRFRRLVAAIVYLAVVDTARPDLIVSNAAGVKAGITGIVHHFTNNTVSVGVDFFVLAPTATNVTTFTIQTNSNLKAAWTDYSSTQVVTGSTVGTNEISDLPNATNRFYRMRLINFQ